MSISNMVYDIRTKESAQLTLERLTDVKIEIWHEVFEEEGKYPSIEEFIDKIVKSKGGCLPGNYEDFEFTYFHITTSANECESIKKHGLLDLKSTYLRHESELRAFLEKNDVFIDINNCSLTYKGQTYDISCKKQHGGNNKNWNVGRKLYYNDTTWGFLSIDKIPYGGEIHYRPEILKDIDILLRTQFSQEWKKSHCSYEIIIRTKGENVEYTYANDHNDKDKVLTYLRKAYVNAFYEINEEPIAIKEDRKIQAEQIYKINRKKFW